MRLTKSEIKAIKRSLEEAFGDDAIIYLFGSRVDDTQRGGDIDLYIQAKDKTNLMSKKIDFLVSLKQKIGDQKIDVVIARDKNRLIEQEALKGIRL